jgi:hypothetical protein
MEKNLDHRRLAGARLSRQAMRSKYGCRKAWRSNRAFLFVLIPTVVRRSS